MKWRYAFLRRGSRRCAFERKWSFETKSRSFAKTSNRTTNGCSGSPQTQRSDVVWLDADLVRLRGSTLHAGQIRTCGAKHCANRERTNDAKSCAVHNRDRNSTRSCASSSVGWSCQNVLKRISKCGSTKSDENRSTMRSLPKSVSGSNDCCTHLRRLKNGWRGCACCANCRIRCTGRRRGSRVRRRTRIDRSCRIPLIRMKIEKRQGDYHNSI